MVLHHPSSSSASERHVWEGVMISFTYFMSFGLGVIVGAGVGILLVFKKMHWLIRWGIVDE
jgi:hypothetical protein